MFNRLSKFSHKPLMFVHVEIFMFQVVALRTHCNYSQLLATQFWLSSSWDITSLSINTFYLYSRMRSESCLLAALILAIPRKFLNWLPWNPMQVGSWCQPLVSNHFILTQNAQPPHLKTSTDLWSFAQIRIFAISVLKLKLLSHAPLDFPSLSGIFSHFIVTTRNREPTSHTLWQGWNPKLLYLDASDSLYLPKKFNARQDGDVMGC